MINPYTQGTRTAFSPEKHCHSALASWPLTADSVSQGRGALHSRGGWWMCQKSEVQNSNGKGEMFSPAQAQQDRPALPHDQGVPTPLDTKKKKDYYFFPFHSKSWIYLSQVASVTEIWICKDKISASFYSACTHGGFTWLLPVFLIWVAA